LFFLKENTIGINQFKVETAFGSTDLSYYGEVDGQQINLRRDTGFSFQMAPYPDAIISVDENGANSTINIRISLSVYWKILLCLSYCAIVFGVLFKLIYSDVAILPLILKGFCALIFLQMFTLVFHFTEKNRIRKIIENLVRTRQCQYDSLQSRFTK
jgi:hypothetical protein